MLILSHVLESILSLRAFQKKKYFALLSQSRGKPVFKVLKECISNNSPCDNILDFLLLKKIFFPLKLKETHEQKFIENHRICERKYIMIGLKFKNPFQDAINFKHRQQLGIFPTKEQK